MTKKQIKDDMRLVLISIELSTNHLPQGYYNLANALTHLRQAKECLNGNPNGRPGDYFRSPAFKKSFAARVKRDTWEKGRPMVYMNDKRQIVKHYKGGKKIIIKK